MASHDMVIFDLETTGTDTNNDRIISFAARKWVSDEKFELEFKCNPGIPIPEGATAVHGISNEDVAGLPSFMHYSALVMDFIEGLPLAGYNIASFDVPMLDAELRRCGLPGLPTNVKIIDALLLWRAKETRTLSDAFRHFCDLEHAEAHDAMADVEVCDAILEKMCLKYGITEAEVPSITGTDQRLDFSGSFVTNDAGEVVFSFGKHKGKVASSEHGYLKWMLSSDFSASTKQVATMILNGELQ